MTSFFDVGTGDAGFDELSLVDKCYSNSWTKSLCWKLNYP